jgi:hypothetical protein
MGSKIGGNDFGRVARFRSSARYCKRSPEPSIGLHYKAFVVANASNFRYLFFDLPDASLIALIERPLLYPLGTDESRM